MNGGSWVAPPFYRRRNQRALKPPSSNMSNMDIPDILATIFGVGGPALLGMLGGVYLAKSAVAQAVEHAADLALVRLKGELAADLEMRKQAFVRELEDQRKQAARGLEAFKADLTLAAETRRLVAARRVEAVAELMVAAGPLQRLITNRGSSASKSIEAHKSLMDYFKKVQERAFLFDAETSIKLSDYASHSWRDGAALERGDEEALTRLSDRHQSFLSVLRAILDPKNPPAGE